MAYVKTYEKNNTFLYSASKEIKSLIFFKNYLLLYVELACFAFWLQQCRQIVKCLKIISQNEMCIVVLMFSQHFINLLIIILFTVMRLNSYNHNENCICILPAFCKIFTHFVICLILHYAYDIMIQCFNYHKNYVLLWKQFLIRLLQINNWFLFI